MQPASAEQGGRSTHSAGMSKSAEDPFEALHCGSARCEERDHRFLNGGNFFGSEPVAEPPREPLAIDSMDITKPGEMIAASGQAVPQPQLLLKLPGTKGK